MSDKTVELLAGIAERLGFEAARLWPQIVMVTWITSLFWAIVDPILIALAVGISIWMIRSTYAAMTRNRAAYLAAKADPRGSYVSSLDYDTMEHGMLCALVVGVLVFICAAALVNWPNSIAGALWPEAQTVLKLAGK